MLITSDFPTSESIHVLHVDDEEDQLFISKRFLNKVDPSLILEQSLQPENALKKLQEEQFDCVVTDYKMPGMDGIELASRIRESSGIPIIMYTGRGSEEVAEKAFNIGVNDYIRKEMDPTHFKVLAERIRAAVMKHRAEMKLKARAYALGAEYE
jgi:DNA-binding response OmpR family regulator